MGLKSGSCEISSRKETVNIAIEIIRINKSWGWKSTVEGIYNNIVIILYDDRWCINLQW